jgi:serine/threonine-protein kinase
MTDESRVQHLLDEVFESGRTPENVCGDCPELLSAVRRRWEEMRHVEAELDALFPTPRTGANLDTPPGQSPETDLPRIPGYEVDAVLGRGGMGIVFRATHLRLNRPVAVKMLLAGAYAGASEKARFQREAVAVAKLRHANIVQVYDVGDVDGRPYFTMEYIEGGSLAKKLAGTPQPAKQAAQLVATLAGAMQAAHECGIIHRDLKPANVLLTANGASDFSVPKIVDFGIARRLEGNEGPALTLEGTPIGTASYMAPEQALGVTAAPADLCARVDVYALGAILYELLTGRPPFRAATAAETVQQVISQDPAPPSRLNDKVPRDLETICLKCLAKEPSRRYASAAALADDLRCFDAGRPILARPVGWAERSWRWGRRNPMAAALLVTALALVGLASGGGMWAARQRGVQQAEAAQRDREMNIDVGTTVDQAASLRKTYHFDQARELLEQARQRAKAGPDKLRSQVEQALYDLNVATRLDAARLQAATLVSGEYDYAGADRRYAEAFADAGLGREGDDVATLAKQVNESALRAELVGALDDWVSICANPTRQAWLLKAARAADPDFAQYRPSLPDLPAGSDELLRLASDVRATELSPQLTTALARSLRLRRVNAQQLLSEAQARFPNDFWLNFYLGVELHRAKRWHEALAFYQAALAIRPKVSLVHNYLGLVRYELGQIDAAMDHFQHALALDPKHAAAHFNLGNALRSKDQLDAAIDHFKRGVELSDEDAAIHTNLGNALAMAGRMDEAIGQFQRALRLDPNYPKAHYNLGNLLSATGQWDQAIDRFQQALRLDPQYALAHYSLGNALSAKRQWGEAIDHYQQAIKFNTKLTLARTLLASQLHAAACGAIRAATGTGLEQARPAEREAVGLRRQALSGLLANLDLVAEIRNDGELVDSPLPSWQTDIALASVRDPAELTKLPDAERAEWQRFWMDLARQVAADPLLQGRARAANREWEQAAGCYARMLARGPIEDGHFWFEYTALLLLSDDRPGYAKACAHMVDRCGNDRGMRSYHVARACTLAPDAIADGTLPGRLAEKELQGAAKQFWSLTEQGALAYRGGRYQEAVPLFERSLKADPQAGKAVVNWLWLALAYQQIDKPEEARRRLVKAQAWLDQFGDGMPARADQEIGLHLHNWLEAHVLRREAEALMQSTSSGKGPGD